MLRVAVLGAGRIGRIHAANAALNRNTKLVAVADPFGDGAKTLAAEWGCEATTDPLATLQRADIDAVVIGTPTDTHVALTLEAVRAGKAVLCEKPIDLDISKVDAAVAEVERLNGRVMVAFNRRFDPSAQAMRKSMDAGEIGELRQVIISSRDPGPPPRDYVKHSGGIFRDMTIHDFDMARWLLGEEPVEISASASRLIDPSLEEFEDFDTVMVNLRTASGRQCHINCCRATSYGYDQRMEVFGADGMLLNENLRASTLRRWSGAYTEAREPLLNFFLERYEAAYRTEFEHFRAAVEGNKAMPVTMHDGRQALRLADAALESALSGRVVTV
ncbi:inositol 2-dehydrogenase [Acidocella facilis]|uniref:inositol 2-dehydrogenase n=1 Tax=Acidocella facilis TaxID=525 RepID=UPI001F42E49A|nr:inositol 2-dehydrogenase [Acidocella facilis]